MAFTADRVIVELEAKLDRYSANVNRARSDFGKAMGGIQGSAAKAEGDVRKSFFNMSSSVRALTVALGGLSVVKLSGDVLRYADAWTKAKNSLAVAGVVGKQQVTVLDQLFASAQRNGAPIEALTSLYGSAAQAQKELGATSQQLIKFSDGVAVALRVAGKSSTEASGALTQLGQLLGSSRVQAEEFNSVNEGARPILQAVAAGITEAGGSVARLKVLVNDGNVSNKQFFEGFLRGLPVIQAMANNALPTLEQSTTKINNALTKYIGTQDQSLGATRVLANALAAIANDFDNVADVTLKVAAIIAAALIGRAITGMIASLGAGALALGRFTRTLVMMRNAVGVTTALTGLGAALGPVGALLGVAAAAGYYFYEKSQEAAEGAKRAEEAIAQMGDTAESRAEAIRRLADELKNLNDIQLAIKSDDNSELIGQQSQNLRDLGKSLPGAGGVGRGKVIPASGAALEFNRATDQFLNDNDLKAYTRALAALNKQYPDQVKIFAQALEAANKYNKAIERQITVLEELEKRGDAQEAPLPSRFDRTTDQGLVDINSIPKPGPMGANALADAYKSDRDKAIDKQTADLIKAYEKIGLKIDDALRDIARRTATTIVDAPEIAKRQSELSGSAIDNYVDRVIKAESGGKTNAKNPLSSATGLGQFIESTWLDLFKRYFPDRAKGMSDAAILALRTEAETSKALIKAYAQENANALQKAGHAVTEANLHLAHFLGPTGAVKALNASPSANAADVLGSGVVNANRAVFKPTGTIQDVLDYSSRRANDTRVAAGDLTPAEERQKEIDDLRKDQGRDSKRRVEDLQLETDAIAAQAGVIEERFNPALEKKKYILEQLRELEDKNIEASPEDIARIEAEADAVVAAEQKKFDAKQNTKRIDDQIKGVREATDFFAEQAGAGLIDVIMQAKTAEDAVKGLLKTLIEAGLKAALLGQGPLAGLFGTAAPGGGVGGLLGGLFGGFKAGGGDVDQGKAYVVGEERPELFVPGRSGKIIPQVPVMPRIQDVSPVKAVISPSVHMTVDLRGAYGDRELRTMMQETAETAGKQAFAQSVQASDRRVYKNQLRRTELGHD